MSEQPQPTPAWGDPAEQVIAAPVANEDLAAELQRSRKPVSKLTLGLGAGVVVVAAFFGGIATHAAFASNNTNNAAANARPGGGAGNRGTGNFPGGYGRQGAGAPGQGGLGGRGTIGTVDHVDGTTVYVKTQNGQLVKVSTSDTTRVRISTDGAVSDLKDGSQVIVQGQTGSDGTVTAQAITQSPVGG